MPQYQAQGGGAFGGTVFPDSRPRVDVGGILDALGSGATSLVQQHLMATQAANERARQASQDAFARDQAQKEQAFREKTLAAEQGQHDIENQRASDAAKAEQQQRDREFLEKGGVLATPGTPGTPGIQGLHAAMSSASQAPVTLPMPQVPNQTGASTVPPSSTVTMQGPPAVMRAMTTAPTPAVAPTAPVPEHVDQQKAANYVTTLARAQAQGVNQATHDARVDTSRRWALTTGAYYRQQLQDARDADAAARQKAGLAAKGAVSGAAQEKVKDATATALMQQYGGDAAEVDAFLRTPEGKAEYSGILDPSAPDYVPRMQRALSGYNNPGYVPIGQVPKEQPPAAPPFTPATAGAGTSSPYSIFGGYVPAKPPSGQ